ncbi:hypothetical protein GCM10022403_076950 [Streptomyces coacervatus]|uniref:Uncharacterized protein n=1 Tax=Streptomyces coacervatus TaxID=647381 RepID=A0ABP7J1V0_9ACTN
MLSVLVHRAIVLQLSNASPPVTGAPPVTYEPDDEPGVEYFFIKVTNLSSQREVWVTHIWFATDPEKHVLNPERPLPIRLRLDETFETSIPVSEVTSGVDLERRVRVALSSGDVFNSRLNVNVPPVGFVAGPGSS